MTIVKWNGRHYIFKEDLHNIYLTDIEESLKHKREITCIFSKAEESTVDCFKQLQLIIESSLGQLVSETMAILKK